MSNWWDSYPDASAAPVKLSEPTKGNGKANWWDQFPDATPKTGKPLSAISQAADVAGQAAFGVGEGGDYVGPAQGPQRTATGGRPTVYNTPDVVFLDGQWRQVTPEYRVAEEQNNRVLAQQADLPDLPTVTAPLRSFGYDLAGQVLRGSDYVRGKVGLETNPALTDQVVRTGGDIEQAANRAADGSTLKQIGRGAVRSVTGMIVGGGLARTAGAAAGLGKAGQAAAAFSGTVGQEMGTTWNQSYVEAKDAGKSESEATGFANRQAGISGTITALMGGVGALASAGKLGPLSKYLSEAGGAEQAVVNQFKTKAGGMAGRILGGLASEEVEELSIAALSNADRIASGVNPQEWGTTLWDTFVQAAATMGLINTVQGIRSNAAAWVKRNPDSAAKVAALPDNPSRKQYAEAVGADPNEMQSTAKERAETVAKVRQAIAAVEPAEAEADLPEATVVKDTGKEKSRAARDALFAFERQWSGSRDLMKQDTEYQRLKAAMAAEERSNAAIDAANAKVEGMADRQIAQRELAEGKVDRENVKYAELHTLNPELKTRIQAEAQRLLAETDSPETRKALEKIIQDAGSDVGAAVEKQKDRIVGVLTGEVDQRNAWERQAEAPRPPDPIVQALLTTPEERRRTVSNAMRSVADGEPDDLADYARRLAYEELNAGLTFDDAPIEPSEDQILAKLDQIAATIGAQATVADTTFGEPADATQAPLSPPEPIPAPPTQPQETVDTQAATEPTTGPLTAEKVDEAAKRYEAASGQKFGGRTRPRTLKQRVADTWLKARGVNVVWFGGDDSNPIKGFHDKQTNALFLHDSLGDDAIWYAVGHEFAHASGADQRLVDLPAEIIEEAKRRYYENAAPPYRAILDANPDMLAQEGVAKYMGELLSDDKFRAKLQAENPGLFQRVMEAIQRFLATAKTKAELRVLEEFRRKVGSEEQRTQNGPGKPTTQPQSAANKGEEPRAPLNAAATPPSGPPTTTTTERPKGRPYAPAKQATTAAGRAFEDLQGAERLNQPREDGSERVRLQREAGEKLGRENPQEVRRRILEAAANGEAIDPESTYGYKHALDYYHQQFVKTGSAENLAVIRELEEAYRKTGTASSDVMRSRGDAMSEPERLRAAAIEAMATEPRRYARELQKAREELQEARDEYREAGGEIEPESPDGDGPKMMDQPGVKLADKPTKDTPKLRKARRKLTEAELRLKRLNKRIAEDNKAIIDKLRKRGFDVDNLDKIAASPTQYNEFLQELGALKGGWNDVLFEYWRSMGIMSGVSTQTANIAGSWVKAFTDTLTWVVEATMNPTGKRLDDASWGELKYILAGLPGLTKKAKENLKSTFRNEMSAFGLLHGGERQVRDATPMRAISGKAGKIVRLPFRIAAAMDDWNKTVRGELIVGGFAYRLGKQEGLSGADLTKFIAEQTSNPMSKAWQMAVQSAEKGTLSDRGGKLTSKIDSAARIVRDDMRKAAWEANPLIGISLEPIRYLMPFVQTPVRSLARGLEGTPVELPNTLFKAGKNLAQGKSLLEGQGNRAARQAVAATLTTVLVMSLWDAVGDSDDEETWITGSDDKHPYSIRIGDRWVSYARLDPLATTIGLLLDTIKGFKSGDAAKAASAPALSLVNMTKEKTMLEGIGDVFKLMDATALAAKKGDADLAWSQAKAMATNIGAGWVPNIARSTIAASEQTKTEKGDARSFAGRIQVPAAVGLTYDNPQVGLFGEKRQQSLVDNRVGDTLMRIILPTKAAQDEAGIHPGYRLMARWNRTSADGERFGDMELDRSFKRNGKKYELDDEQFERMATIAGGLLSKLYEQGEWTPDNPTAAQADALRAMIDKARDFSRDHMKREIDEGKTIPVDEAETAELLKRQRMTTLRGGLREGIKRKAGETAAAYEERRQTWLSDRERKRGELAVLNGG